MSRIERIASECHVTTDDVIIAQRTRHEVTQEYGTDDASVIDRMWGAHCSTVSDGNARGWVERTGTAPSDDFVFVAVF